MNKVFSCVHDLNIKIYYQDTDIIHLNYDDVDKVVWRYEGTYNLELVGEDLGNFHVGFDMDGANSETYAIESLFLGNTTYIDILQYTSKEGNTISSEHMIMKGIPTPCMKYYAEQHVYMIYKQLYDNKTVKFDLTNDGNTFVCRNNKDYTVSNISDFYENMPIY